MKRDSFCMRFACSMKYLLLLVSLFFASRKCEIKLPFFSLCFASLTFSFISYLPMYGTRCTQLPVHWKTHSMADRAIPLSVCHHGPPNGYRTGFKRCSDVQLFIQLTVVDDINAKAVEAWKQKDPLSMTCIHWYYSYNTASISDMN